MSIDKRRTNGWFNRPRTGKLSKRTTGSLFVGLGIGMIATQRQA